MLVILTVFFYLYAGFSFSSLNGADNGLLFIRCEVQIPTVMTVINGSNATHEFLNYIAADGWIGKIEHGIENEGKVPTFEVLKKIVRELAIDGNLIFYPEKPVKDSEVEDLVRMLYNCDDRSMKIVKATAKAALESQEAK